MADWAGLHIALFQRILEIFALLNQSIIRVLIRGPLVQRDIFQADEIIGPVEPSSKRPFLIVTIFTLTFICLGLDIYMWSDIVVPIVGPFNFAWQVVPFYFTYVFTMILEVNIWIAVCELTARIRKLDNIMEGTLKKLVRVYKLNNLWHFKMFFWRITWEFLPSFSKAI